MNSITRRQSLLQSFVQAAGVWTVLVGTLVLLGWMFDVPFLKSLLPQFVSMKANTALCFVLLGIALWLLNAGRAQTSTSFKDSQKSPRTKHTLILLCSLIVAGIALLTLLQYLIDVNLGIDELFFLEDPNAIATSSPGRMAPFSATNFFFLAVAIALIETRKPHVQLAGQILNHAAALVSFISILGYLYGVEYLYGIVSTTYMALHTSLTFLVFSSGLICSQQEWVMVRLLVAENVAGATLRRLLPSVVIIVTIIGFLRMAGERAGWYGTEFGVVVYTLSMILLIVPLIWWNAYSLDRSDKKQRELTETLEQQTNILNSVLDSMGDGVVVADMTGKFIIWNKAARQLVGRGPAEVPSQQWSEYYGVFLPDQQTPYPPERSPLVRALQGESTGAEEQFLRHPENPLGVWLSVTGRPLIDQHGTQHGGVVVFNDISDRKRAEQELQQLNTQLEHANKELEAFSYSVSHDLRAPLRHIDGFTELLLKRAVHSLDDQSKRYLNTIAGAAKHMGALIDDLLVFSRMGRAELRKSSFNLHALVNEVIGHLGQETTGREIEWNIKELPSVTADREMLGLVLQNLLGNAVKYTRPRPRASIEIGAATIDRERLFYIKDNGVGFDMKYIDKLFGVFQRLHRADEFEGTGIGLANVRRIVSRHGGRTWAEAVTNKGATFYFTLPAETESNQSP